MTVVPAGVVVASGIAKQSQDDFYTATPLPRGEVTDRIVCENDLIHYFITISNKIL